ncbi:hypothetical protein ES702_04159 [subsurface metagenome]
MLSKFGEFLNQLNVDCNMNKLSSSELSANSILMLVLVSGSSKRGWLGITKLQKLSFLVEYFLDECGKRAFGYNFFMYDHGPISKGVYYDYELLLDEELMIEDEDGIQVSELGNSISEQFVKDIPEEIRTVMQSVINNYAHMKTHELTNFVHKMEIKLPDGSVVRIDDLYKGYTVLPKSLENALRLGKDYLETLAILANKSLIEAIRMARKKGSTSSPYKPLT